jgi:hypothetical protein
MAGVANELTLSIHNDGASFDNQGLGVQERVGHLVPRPLDQPSKRRAGHAHPRSRRRLI